MIFNAGGMGAAGAGEAKVPISATCVYSVNENSSSYTTFINASGKGYVDFTVNSKNELSGYLTIVVDGVTLANGKYMRELPCIYGADKSTVKMQIRFNKSIKIQGKMYSNALHFNGVAFFEE